MRNLYYLSIILLVLILVTGNVSGKSPRIGIRGGIGTDAELGLAYGIGVNFLVELPSHPLELGLVLFGGSFEETTDEGINVYEETTDLLVFGAIANYLLGYKPDESGFFGVAGIGLAAISVEWEETSTTDESLGTPLPGGGSSQSADGTAGGFVFNLGFGGNLSNGLDFRLELPVIVTFSSPGESSSVLPALMLTAGYRF